MEFRRIYVTFFFLLASLVVILIDDKFGDDGKKSEGSSSCISVSKMDETDDGKGKKKMGSFFLGCHPHPPVGRLR